MTDIEELRRALEAIAAALEVLGGPWAVGGSVASAAYGEPRATNDVDVVAVIQAGDARQLVASLGSDFYADADAALAAVRDRSSFNVIDQRSFIKIDIFVPGPGPLGAGQLDRRRTLELLPGSRPIPVLGPEDVILQKLRWYQLGGGVSDRQWRDVVSVLSAQRDNLDRRYLAEVAGQGGLEALLAKAVADAGSK